MTWYNINNIHDTCRGDHWSPAHRSTIILNVKPEQNYIPVLDHVILTLAADKSLLLRGVHAAAGDELVEADDLGADESTLEIGMYFSGGLRSLRALDDGPRADLLRSGGQVADESEERVACLDEAVKTAFLYSEVL